MTYNMKSKFYSIDFEKLKRRAIISACVLGFLLLFAVIIGFTVDAVTVFCNGESKVVYTFSDNAEAIVARTNFTVNENDRILDGKTEGFDNILYIAKEHTVLVYDGNKFITRMKFAGTVEEALKKANVKLRKGDETNFPLWQGIDGDICIRVSRGFKVTVTADGKTEERYFVGGTAEQLLNKAGIVFDSDDIVIPDRNQKVKKGDRVILKRVKYEYETKKSVIEYETKVEYDENKYEDEAKVKRKGKNGKKTETIAKMYVDGKYTESKVVKTVVTKEPVTKIVVRGKKERPGGYIGGYVTGRKVISELKPPYEIELDEKNRPVKYEKIITGKATAYCTGTTCSTGVRAMPGRVAVDPREIPYGTKMYIVSSDGKWHYGYATASDTGGFIYNSSTVVDVYMRSYEDCINFGRRNVDIYILEWG